MKNELVTTREATELLCTPVATFNWWTREAQVLKPAAPGKGKGSGNSYTIKQVWCIGIAKSLKSFGVETACKVASLLEDMPDKAIQEAFGLGKSCLLILNCNGELTLVPQLFSESAIADNPELKKQRKEAQKHGIVFQWTAIDTKPMLDQIVKTFEEKRAERN